MRRSAREAGVIMATLMAIAVIYTLFAYPAIGAKPDNTYANTLFRLGLAFESPERVMSGAAVETFSYTGYGYAELLNSRSMAMVYPAAIVRALTEPFGAGFSTRLLALVYTAVLVLSAYLMTSGIFPHSKMGAYVAGICMILPFMQTGIAGYLNSLYEVGAAITFFALYASCLVNAHCRPRGAGTRHTLRVAVSGLLFLTSQEQLIILWPFVTAGIISAAVRACPLGPRKAIHKAACAAALLYLTVCVYGVYADSDDLHSNATNHLAVFQGILTVSDDPRSDIIELGLDESYLNDVGRSYYDSPEAFAHDPNAEAEQAMLSEKLNSNARLRFTLRHPEWVFRRISNLKVYFYDTFNDLIITEDGNTRFERLSPYLLLSIFLPRTGLETWYGWMLVAVALSLALTCVSRRKSGARGLFLSLAALFAGLLFYLPWCVALTGGTDLYIVKVVFLFFGWSAFFASLAMGAFAAKRISLWLGEKDGRLRFGSVEKMPYMPLSNSLVIRARVTKGGIVWTSAVICACIVCALLLPQKHIGGVNNGDYMRMMEQIDLYWTEDLLENEDLQAGAFVIEKYTYREPFHPERLTSIDPTYSLIFPSMAARLASLVTGDIYDTRITAFVMLGLTITGILIILYDMYGVFGNLTVFFAAALIAMLLGENYVAWYNSLFGESAISTGLVMTVACAIRLSVMKREAKGGLFWLIMLCFSVRFLVCAKAQMILALASGLPLIAALAWTHRPRGAVRVTAFALLITASMGLICWDAYKVYDKNSDVSSRQTVWQSVFYGALMIADDPEAAMAQLNIPLEMAADIGKHAYYPDEDYVYAPMSKEAEEKFYSRVNTFTMVKYYLSHPKDFLSMLDRAARESVELHTGNMAYTGNKYAEDGGPYRFVLWKMLRPFAACRAFWQYVLLYGAAIVYYVRKMLLKVTPRRDKLFALIFICVILTGALQYPLSVVGNGFADNNKQLYGFMLCHDLIVVTALTAFASKLISSVLQKEADN